MRPVPGKLKERCDQCRTLGGRHIAYTPRIYSTFEQKEQLFQVCQQPLSGPSCYCHAVHVYNHLTGSACLQPSPCGMLTCTLQDVCHLLKQGLNASVILVGPHSSSTLASSRHILCSVADHLSKLPQAANYNIEVGCCLEFSSQAIDLFGCSDGAEVSTTAASSTSLSKQQHGTLVAAGPATQLQVLGAAQIRKALKLGSNSTGSSAAASSWLVGDVQTSHHRKPREADHLEAVVSRLWYSSSPSSSRNSSSNAVAQHSSCLTVIDLTRCYRAAECAGSWPGQLEASCSSSDCSPTRRSPGLRHQAQSPNRAGSGGQQAAGSKSQLGSRPGSASLWLQLAAYIHKAASHIHSKAGVSLLR